MYQPLTNEEQARVRHGIQCPECSSVDIQTTASRFVANAEQKHQCNNCGCRWDRNYFRKITKA